ncbi:WXG100 family type VII secretion target [Nocardia testacea]|uniref:WXG100 family type VII secretion target n=1 Tax=Nocardia testacea TaxID=248551 RepID=UPI0002EB980F|nr:WXG100 family type VII secretion target [Nocardia testacea]
MAGQSITQANPDDLVAIAKKMDGPLQGLETNLGRLTNIQGILEAAFKGNAGQAVYNAFGNVHSTGTGVAQYMESVMAQIVQASSKFDQDDRAALQAVQASMGEAADGTYNSGASGTWNNGAENLESTAGPSKAKVDWA